MTDASIRLASYRLKVERRKNVTRAHHAIAVGVALALASMTCSMIFYLAGASPPEAFASLWMGAFGTWENLLDSLVRATPLILTGLATVVAFRAKIWNIGQEGQFFAGAMMAYWAAVSLAGLPAALLFLAIVAFGALGGALWGGAAAVLRTRFGVSEVITTVMSNYIIFYALTYLLSGPWTEPGAFYQQTARLPEATHYPLLIEGSRLHVGIAIALIAAAAMHVMFTRTPVGYAIRAIGENPTASRFKGIKVNRMIILVMLISGAMAGLAGAGELFGLHHRLKTDISGGFGFTGIVIGMLGGLRPFGVLVAAVLFGGLASGSFVMQITTGIPTSVVYAIQAIVLLFFLCATVIAKHRLRVESVND